MEATEFLGPFRNLPYYQDKELLLDMPEGKERFTSPYRIEKSCCFDFDVRPQRTCLTNGRHMRLAGTGADWGEIINRCVLSVSRTMGLIESSYSMERGIEGESDNGSVVCWVRVLRPGKRMLGTALRGLAERISKQSWPEHHPEKTKVVGEVENLLPGQDRISIQILDPKTGHSIPMLAENFYLVQQRKNRVDCFHLSEWQWVLDNAG